MRDGCVLGRSWGKAAGDGMVPGLISALLFGYSCPMRKPARISCFVLRSCSWPPPPLSELDSVVIVSAINLLLKADLGKPFIRIDCSLPPPPPKGFCNNYLIASLATLWGRQDRDLFSHFIDEGTNSVVESLCRVIWWTWTQVSWCPQQCYFHNPVSLAPRTTSIRGNLFLDSSLNRIT